jgi:hypothetical protein
MKFNPRSLTRTCNNIKCPVVKHSYFVVNDEVFAAVGENAYELTEIPPEEYFITKPLGTGQTVFWGLNDFIWLAYALKDPNYEGRLFGRLAAIRIVPVGDAFTLAPNVKESWQLLEVNLFRMFQILISTAVVDMAIPLSYSSPNLPSICGYLKSHRTHGGALRSAHKSREDFCLLMGALSFAIMMHKPESDSFGRPRWAKTLEENGVHPEYIQLVVESRVADFSARNERVGCIIGVNNLWLNFVSRMEIANVPFWIHFGRFRKNLDPYWDATYRDVVQKYYPTPEEVEAARAAATWKANASSDWGMDTTTSSSEMDTATSNLGVSTSSGWGNSEHSVLSGWGTEATASDWGANTSSDHVTNPTTSDWRGGASSITTDTSRGTTARPPLSDIGQFPRPEANSRQLYGETWQDFFARDDERNTKRWARASAEMVKVWKSRQRDVGDKQTFPGKGGAVVFEWDDINDNFPGFLIRTRVGRKEVERVWGSFAPTQRRFNPCENEWDLCRPLDPGAPSDDAVWEAQFDSDDDNIRPIGPPPPSPPPSSAPQTPTTPNFLRDLEETYDDGDGSIMLHHPRHVVDTLRCHYGFQLDFDPAAIPVTTLTWKKAMSYLVDSFDADADDDPTLSNDDRNAICAFIQLLTESKTSTIPPSFWDLSLYSLHPLHEHRDPRIFVEPVTAGGGKISYIIRTATVSSDWPYSLIVPTAASVLECMRCHWGPSLSCYNIAQYLFQQGMPFSVRSTSPPAGPPGPPIPYFEPLGWRCNTYKFSHIDYLSYTYRLRNFFKQAYARAALESEGIVWRIARAFFGQDMVLLGPALEDGHTDFISSSCGNLWGDTLSERDLELICGVYKVEGKSGKPQIYVLYYRLVLLTVMDRAYRADVRFVMVA